MAVYNMAMKTPRPFVLLLCLALLLLPGFAAGNDETINNDHFDPPQSILFVGNSFTFYNNSIYLHLRKLLQAEDPATRQKIFLKSMTISGAVLTDHRGGLQQMLESRAWEVIVLQGHSREAIEPDMARGFQSAAKEFSGTVRSRGAEPVLFMTWAYADRPEMTDKLVAAYTRLGEESGMRVVPVGLAFANAQKQVDGIRLHDADNVHPSLAGTYLAAAVFYSALYGKSPAALAYEAGLDGRLAHQLREIAWKTVVDYKSGEVRMK